MPREVAAIATGGLREATSQLAEGLEVRHKASAGGWDGARSCR